MRLIFRILVITSLIIAFSCSSSQKTVQQPQTIVKATPKPVSNTYTFSTDEGIDLKVDIEYLISETGYLNNDCRFSYFVTNTSNKDYEAKIIQDSIYTVSGYEHNKRQMKLAYLYFDANTSDGKVFEHKVRLREITAGRSDKVRNVFTLKVGKDRFCTGIKASRIEYK